MTCPVEWTDLVGCYPPGPHHCDRKVDHAAHDSRSCACGAFVPSSLADAADTVLALLSPDDRRLVP